MTMDKDRRFGSLARWWALVLLTGIYAANSLDRNVLSVIMEPVKREFQVSDTAMGALAGLAHTTAFAVCVIPMGLLADRVNRVRLISILVILWSGLTALGATASNYLGLLFLRMGVGATEAGSPPASIALIADLFPVKVRPTALSLYYFAAAIGTGTMFFMGGYVAHRFGWRTVFIIAALPGLLLGIALFATVKDPRSFAPQSDKPGRGAVLALLRSRALLWACVGGTLASTTQTSVWTWMTSFLIRGHHFSLVNAALVAAASAGLGKGLGTLLSGPLTRLAARDVPSRLWRYSGVTLFLSVPLTWYMTATGSDLAAAWSTIALGVVLGGWSGPAAAIMITGVAPRSRGLATGMYQLMTNLIGGAGPLLTGAISDALGGKIGPAIAITATVNLLAALGLFLSCQALSRTPALIEQ